MAHHEESPTSDTVGEGLRHRDKDEPEPRNHDGSYESPDQSSHQGAVGGALIGGAVGGTPGLVGGALLGSVLDEDDAE